MFIGIALVITMSGQYVTQAQPFDTKAQCVSQIRRIASDARKSEKVLAFRLECVEAGGLEFRKAPPAHTPESAERPRPRKREFES